jgi:murein DD-endopeptidase MepM/ murein hydrolase activator NlpD
VADGRPYVIEARPRGFGPRRDPIIGRPAFHSGIDFRAPPGAPIKSAGAGTVVSAGWNGGYGRMVEVDHGNGITTRYAHMSRISVSRGDKVETGTVLGRVGSTGRSTGPHLHFEVRKGGEAVDPRPFLRAGRKIADLI